jgi:hypothetical protein
MNHTSVRRRARAAKLSRPWPLALLTLALVAWPVAAPAADDGPNVTDPACALLVGPDGDLRNSPVAALLEAELAGGGLRMVERQAVDLALKEQAVSGLLGPDAVGGRLKLGRVLGADVLVLLDGDPRAAGKARLIVCDAASGIRTMVRTVAVDGDAAAAAGRLAADVRSAVGAARRRLAGAELCGVPPFVSRDLAYDFDAMKAACAVLAEQAVATRTGLLTVELAEARALERELVLAGQAGRRLERPLPLYVLGEYRNGGRADARRVSVELALKRGPDELARRSRRDLKPDDVAAAVGDLVAELLAGRGDAAPAADPGAEVGQLVRRAAEFELVGDWREAADLYEACLLLDPGSRQARAKVIAATTRVPRPEVGFMPRDQAYDVVLQTHLAYRRRLAHQEAYLRRFPAGPKDWDLADMDTSNMLTGDTRDPRVVAVMSDTRLAARTIRLSLLHQRLRDGAPDALVDLWEGQNLWLQAAGESAGAGFDRLFDLVSRFRGHPKARRWVKVYSFQYWPEVGRGANGASLYAGDAAWEPYLRRLEATGDADLVGAAADVRKHRADQAAEDKRGLARRAEREAQERATTAARRAPATGPTVAAEPIDLRLDLGKGVREQFPPRVVGWIPIGPKTDLLWGHHDLFVMTEPGVARAVWSDAQRSRASFESVCFDGRYVWAVGRHGEGRALVLDPATGKSWEATKADGLLPMSRAAAVVPLGPGRACVIAGFQPPGVQTLAVRGWCAEVTLDPAKGPSVTVFHEANRVVRDDYKEKLAGVDVGFGPTYAAPIGTGADRRLVVGREIDANSYRCFTPPLLLDPERRTVALWAGDPKLPGRRNGPWTPLLAGVDGALLFVEPPFVEGRLPPKGWRPKLFRATGPAAAVTQVGQLPPVHYKQDDPEGQLASAVAFGGRVYLAGPLLHAVDPAVGTDATATVAYPDGPGPCSRLAVSSHFGLVTWRNATAADRKYREDFFRLDAKP